MVNGTQKGFLLPVHFLPWLLIQFAITTKPTAVRSNYIAAALVSQSGLGRELY